MGVLRLLLGAGADAAATDVWGMQALHEAALGGHISAVEALVEAGADINATTGRGRHCLHYFAEHVARRDVPAAPQLLRRLLALGAQAAVASSTAQL